MNRLALLMLLASIFLPLAGCGGSEDAATAEEASPEGASSSEVPNAETRRVEVRTVIVQPEEIQDIGSLPADLLPARRALLASEVPGTVERLFADEGQRVRAGASLAAIDTRALEQEVAEAVAVDRRAEARFKRATSLFEKRSITQQQLLDAVTDRDVAQARLATAKLRLSKSRIKAPWSGEIASRRVEVGDYVTPGQGVMEIVDTSTLKVRAPAPAADVPFLEVGAPVTLRLEGYESEDTEPGAGLARGKIVRLAAELDSSTRTLDVEAEIPNDDGRLRPGLFGSLEVVRRTIPAALMVPLSALIDLGGEDGLYVVENDQALRRTVRVSRIIGERALVSEGLQAGDHVVLAGQEQLADGQPVRESTL